jgi:hypothetical protein
MEQTTNTQFKLGFRYNFNPSYQPTPAEMESEGQKWGQWIGSLAQNGQFISTTQLGYEGKILHNDGTITEGIYMHNSEVLAGDMIINAKDMEEAINLSRGCPIFDAGGNVEVRAIIPM